MGDQCCCPSGDPWECARLRGVSPWRAGCDQMDEEGCGCCCHDGTGDAEWDDDACTSGAWCHDCAESAQDCRCEDGEREEEVVDG